MRALLIAASLGIVALGCDRTADGDLEVDRPVMGTEKDTVVVDKPVVGTTKDTINVPDVNVGTKRDTIIVDRPTVDVDP